MAAEILFHAETGGQLPEHPDLLRGWIGAVVAERGGQLGPLNYVFCGDDYLHRLNVEYLDHDTLTDIITFPYATFPLVSGDLFVSVERVAANATELNVPFAEEWHRVMIHGVLHLCGQADKSPQEAAVMRKLEDEALSQRPTALLSLL